MEKLSLKERMAGIATELNKPEKEVNKMRLVAQIMDVLSDIAEANEAPEDILSLVDGQTRAGIVIGGLGMILHSMNEG